eukprot:TRINITY_DN18095_c0_g1_i1.p1 TRINITY_DN18095_c0_g1~~TRINITY_DN18095_c0_g1_i1.p1  ORF type:complete len:527 (+),score=117.98 TRINITY_DN18095_c0_g1_i1:155-1582(+)
MSDEERLEAMRGKLKGVEYLPIVNHSYGHGKNGKYREEEDVGKLPFLRNRGVGSFFDVVEVMGDPAVGYVGAEMPQKLNVARPYAKRYDAKAGPKVSSSQFMGSFLNAFVALDVDEWDIDALLDDIEAPSPHRVIRHLTELLQQRHMNPRKLTDYEISRILLRSKTGDEAEKAFKYALEHHEVGSLAVESLGKVAGLIGDPRMATEGLKLLEGKPVGIETLNAVMKAFKKKEDAGDGMVLFEGIYEGRYGAGPDTVTYNAALRLLEGDNEEVLKVWERMMDDGVPPNTYTMNAVVKAVGRVGGFDEAAGVFEAMVGDDVKANGKTWGILLEVLTNETGFEPSECHTRLLWIVNYMTPTTPLTPWTHPALPDLLCRTHLNYRHIPLSEPPTPQSVAAYLSTTATLYASDPSPLYLLLAEGAFVYARDNSLANVPSIYTSILAVLTNAGRHETAQAIYDDIAGTAFHTEDHRRIMEG